MGKFLAALIVVCAIGAGAGIYYFQVYGYYEEVPVTGSDVVLTRPDGTEEVIDYGRFQAIDAKSSPIRYRACFTASSALGMLVETYAPYPGAEPREAPGWFGCFDADKIGAALESGQAKAFLSVENVHYGIDRVAAVFPDGSGYVWHQINRCGKVVFDGKPAPEDCPPPPGQ